MCPSRRAQRGKERLREEVRGADVGGVLPVEVMDGGGFELAQRDRSGAVNENVHTSLARPEDLGQPSDLLVDDEVGLVRFEPSCAVRFWLAVASSSSLRRATPYTVAPAAASAIAVALPMPLLAPVTTHVWPSSAELPIVASGAFTSTSGATLTGCRRRP